MADPLLYNALDSYLYIDTQLAAATSQAQTAEANRAAKSVSAACCICCWCLCQAVKAACDTPLDPNIQQIIDENLFCWECTVCIPDKHGQTGWTTCCLHWPNAGAGQCNTSSMACNWTAPANTDCIQIDMWGAGANSYGVSCCGGADGGGTGAFVSMTMPWCAGWTVQTCAGCAQCCYIQGYPGMPSATQINNGRPSCMSGCGFKAIAAGGKSGTKRILQGTPINRFANQCFGGASSGAGQCYCNQGYFCYTSCSTCGIIGPMTNLTNFGICYCGQTATTEHGFSALSVGVPGMIGCRCFDTGFGGWIKSVLPPRFPMSTCNCSIPTSCTCCSSFCTNDFSSCSVCCGKFDNGYARWPGAGGRGGKYNSGGCREGDIGRGGGFRIIVHSCA